MHTFAGINACLSAQKRKRSIEEIEISFSTVDLIGRETEECKTVRESGRSYLLRRMIEKRDGKFLL